MQTRETIQLPGNAGSMRPDMWLQFLKTFNTSPLNGQYEFDYDNGNRIVHYLIEFTQPLTILDPTNLEQNDLNNAFRKFLDKEVKQGNRHFEPGIYDLGDNRWIYLTHEMVHRYKKNFKRGTTKSRYSVLDNQYFARGSFGRVTRILGTSKKVKGGLLSFSGNPLAFDQRKDRIIKIQNHEEGTNTELKVAEREVKTLEAAPHSHVKPLTVVMNPDFDNLSTSYLVMKKFPGKPLNELKNELSKLTIAQRLLLSKNILMALQEQIHDRGIIHRDIKPENIIVDLETMEVNFIDLGLSVKAPKTPKTETFIGTPPYMSVEALTNDSPIDKASDVSSIALTLASSLWGATGRKFGFMPMQGDIFIPQKMRAMYQAYVKGDSAGFLPSKEEGQERTIIGATSAIKELPDLLANVSGEDLGLEEKASLKQLFDSMIHHDKNRRPSLDDAIEIFDNMAFTKKLEHMEDEKLLSSLRVAHKKGAKARGLLREIAKSEEYGTEKPAHSINEIDKVIMSAMEDVDDTSLALKEFTQTLGVTAFDGLTNKEDIQEKLHKTFDTFYANINHLLALSRDVKNQLFLIDNLSINKNESLSNKAKLIDDLKSFEDDIDIVLGKHENRIATVDDIAALNKYFSKRLNDFTGPDGRIGHLKINDRLPHSQRDYVKTYRDILNQEPGKKAEDQKKAIHMASKEEELQQLKDNIILAMQTYIYKTLTPKNAAKKDRAASEKRRKNIESIFKAVQEAQTSEALITDVEKELKNIRSIFGFNINIFSRQRSELYKLIEEKIEAHQKRPQPLNAHGI